MRTLYITIVLTLLLPITRIEARDVSREKVDSMRRELKEANYAPDSIMMLYNIFDASSRTEQKKMAKDFYRTASHAGNVKVQLDLLRNFGNLFQKNDSILKLLIEQADSLPPSAEQKETILFLRLLRVSSQSQMSTPEQKRNYLRKTLQKYRENQEKMSDMEQIELLYTLCVYMKDTSEGELLGKYLKETEEKINELPYGLYALRNMFYAHSALFYTKNEKYQEAVEADRKLLAIMDSLDSEYKNIGRIYRDFDINRYVCYRRMLYNYPALSNGEVDKTMRGIWNLVESNKEIKDDFQGRPLAEAFYYTANKEYVKAKDRIEKVLKKDIGGNAYLRLRLFRMLAEVANATGDTATELYALKEYSAHLSKYIESKSVERFRELQVIYDVENLKAEKDRLEADSYRAKEKNQRLLFGGIVIISILLLVAVLVMYRLYRRSLKLSKGLARMNDTLKHERNTLKESEKQLIAARDSADSVAKMKKDFIDNMNHEVLEPLNAISGYTQLIADNVEAERRKQIDKFVRIVEVNCDILNHIVKDSIALSSLSSNNLHVVRRKVYLKDICDDALSGVELNRKNSVNIFFQKEDALDVTVYTDPIRVQQVLTNLLANAMKFTERGSVSLDYEIDGSNDTVSFTVTDTGCGIPEGKEEVIFERFEKLDPETDGLGLGLAIAREIARLLGGDVTLDTTYRRGARFIFTIPLT